MPTVLLVDDDERFGPMVAEYLAEFDFEVVLAGSVREARAHFDERTPDVAVVDLMLPDGSGLDLLDSLAGEGVPTLVVTGHATMDRAVESLRARASDFLSKPIALEELKARIEPLIGLRERTSRHARAARTAEAGVPALGPLVGTSSAMEKVFTQIKTVAPTAANVLLQGESGTGKELAARAVHELSDRKDGPFLAVNCGAIAQDLIASELFGHEKGSFTGATRQHHGVFERAHGGTLFLDEITEMPADLQTSLLRVLETRTFRRVGGDRDLKSDARVVAATNRDAAQAVAEGRLREDLFFRLSVFPILLPPLRARSGDIALLAQWFLDELNAEYGASKTLADDAIEQLEKHRWPGNVRELGNVMHGAFILSETTITADSVRDRTALTADVGQSADQISPGTTIRELERQLIEKTLAHCDGNKREAAEALGISLKTLYNRLNEYAADDEADPA